MRSRRIDPGATGNAHPVHNQARDQAIRRELGAPAKSAGPAFEFRTHRR